VTSQDTLSAPGATGPAATGRPLAVLTGASSGIGAALAPLIVSDGYDVVLLARRRERLEVLRQTLGPDRCHLSAIDLAAPDAADALAADLAARGRPVEVLVNNAGFGPGRPVAREAPEMLTGMVDVNVRAVVALTRAFLPGMIERGRGGILNVASTAAFQPGPGMATYYATKAFVLSFSEAVSEEVRGKGVTVTALCPGPTKTEFQALGNVEKTPLFKLMPTATADAVARAGWSGFRKGRRVVVPGLVNKIGAALSPLVPHGALLPVVKRINQPSS